jgi:hypothetical protein
MALVKIREIKELTVQIIAHQCSCQSLAKRCEKLQFLEVDVLLEEIFLFLERFVNPDSRSQDELISWFEWLLLEQLSHLKSFQSFNDRIDLLISPNTTNTIGQQLSEYGDARCDLKDLYERISSFQIGSSGWNERLNLLLQQCTNHIALCDENSLSIGGDIRQLGALSSPQIQVIKKSLAYDHFQSTEMNHEIRRQFRRVSQFPHLSLVHFFL